MAFLSNSYVRIAVLAALVLVVGVALRRLWAWIATSEDRAAEARLKAALAGGDLLAAGEIQVERKNLLEATRIFERAKEFKRAGEIHLLMGSDLKAAEAFEKAQEFGRAAPIFRRLGEKDKAAACYAKSDSKSDRIQAADALFESREFLKAGRLYQDAEQYEKAADAYARVDDLASLDVALTMLENAALKRPRDPERLRLWQRAGEFATKLGAHERAARAFDEGEVPDRAAKIYETVLKKFDLAAALYAEAGDAEGEARALAAAGDPTVVAETKLARARARGDTRRVAELEANRATAATAVASADTKIAVPRDKRERPTPEGRDLEGRFELLGELGRGGMGIVYKARDVRLGRLVALKFLPHDAMTNPTLLKLFHREARAAAALSHPGIVTVYDVGTLEDREFIAMEYVEGETLDAVLAKSGPLSAEALVDLATKVLSAIEYAHNKSVIHRDLKPANLMRTKAGVKVMDFGLAKVVNADSSGPQTIIAGTPAYMPPEQATGRTDHRSDLFSLGATFYELLTGVQPGKSGAAAHQTTDYRTPRERNPEIPARLSELVMQCLEHDPRSRPQDASSLLHELRAIARDLEDAGARARPKPRVDPEVPSVLGGSIKKDSPPPEPAPTRAKRPILSREEPESIPPPKPTPAREAPTREAPAREAPAREPPAREAPAREARDASPSPAKRAPLPRISREEDDDGGRPIVDVVDIRKKR